MIWTLETYYDRIDPTSEIVYISDSQPHMSQLVKMKASNQTETQEIQIIYNFNNFLLIWDRRSNKNKKVSDGFTRQRAIAFKNKTINTIKNWCKNKLQIDPILDPWFSPDEISNLRIVMPEFIKKPTLNKGKVSIIFPNVQAGELEIQNLLGFLNLRKANALIVLPKVTKYNHIHSNKPRLMIDINRTNFC